MSLTERRALWAVAHHETGHAIAAEFLMQVPAAIEITRHQRGTDIWFRGRTVFVEPDVEEGRLLVSLCGPAAEARYLHPHATGPELRGHLWRCASTSDFHGCNVVGVNERTLDAIVRFVDQRRAAIAARAAIEVHRYLSSTPGRRGGGGFATTSA